MTEDPIHAINRRLAEGDIDAAQHDDLVNTLQASKAPSEPVGPNIPLILFFTVLLLLLTAQEELTAPTYCSPAEALAGGVVYCLLWPLVAVWAKAVWNMTIPRITGWHGISFWEAAGLLLLTLWFDWP